MDKWVEYDAYTGVTEVNYSSDDDDNVVVQKFQDVQPLLDRNKEVANSGAADIGIKKGLWHYASIPVTVQYELLKKGINIHDPEDARRMFDEINRNYPHLKTTRKTHAIGLNRPKSSPSAENSTPPGPYVIVR